MKLYENNRNESRILYTATIFITGGVDRSEHDLFETLFILQLFFTLHRLSTSFFSKLITRLSSQKNTFIYFSNSTPLMLAGVSRHNGITFTTIPLLPSLYSPHPRVFHLNFTSYVYMKKLIHIIFFTLKLKCLKRVYTRMYQHSNSAQIYKHKLF